MRSCVNAVDRFQGNRVKSGSVADEWRFGSRFSLVEFVAGKVVGELNVSRRQDVQRKLYRRCTGEVCFFLVVRLIAQCVLVFEMLREQALMPNAKDRWT